MVPVEPALGLLAPERPTLVEGFVEFRIEATLQQLGEHRLGGEVDLLHGTPRPGLSYILEM
jgi:hypothetical protein